MQHLAVIMDGNGRWAQTRGLPRSDGHKEGANALVRAISDFITLPIDNLSVYAFSTENNTRNKEEVSSILGVIAYFLKKEIIPLAVKQKICLRFIGDTASLPKDLSDVIDVARNATKGYDKKNIIIAVNYGGVDEICRAVEKLERNNSEITAENLRANLDTAGLPDPEAVLRYGGYKRLSNYMPIQTAYSELFFVDKFWPDYEKNDFITIIEELEKIKRNFGGNNA